MKRGEGRVWEIKEEHGRGWKESPSLLRDFSHPRFKSNRVSPSKAPFPSKFNILAIGFPRTGKDIRLFLLSPSSPRRFSLFFPFLFPSFSRGKIDGIRTGFQIQSEIHIDSRERRALDLRKNRCKNSCNQEQLIQLESERNWFSRKMDAPWRPLKSFESSGNRSSNRDSGTVNKDPRRHSPTEAE